MLIYKRHYQLKTIYCSLDLYFYFPCYNRVGNKRVVHMSIIVDIKFCVDINKRAFQYSRSYQVITIMPLFFLLLLLLFLYSYHPHNSFSQPSILQLGSALNFTKSCSNICSGEGRFSGSLIKHVSTKF